MTQIPPIALKISGPPTSQGRPRFARQGPFMRAYNPHAKEQANAKAEVLAQYRSPPLEEPVSLLITFYMPIPISFSKRKKAAVLNMPHASKPDIDNLLAFTFNALSGILYYDDRLISKVIAQKIYSDNPHTEIIAEVIT